MADDPLAMDPETMRAVGHRTMDWLVDQIGVLANGPALRVGEPAEMRRRLDGPPPENGEGLDPRILRSLTEDVLPFGARWDHPRLMAYVPGSTTWPSALADFIAAACNLSADLWRESAGPSQVELTVLDWFKDWFGYPLEAAGIFVSGGSAANMTALACARESLLGPMSDNALIYVSDQTHSSIARAARVLGFRPEQVRVIPSDRRFRWRPDALEATMNADVASGWQPLVVAAAAGSTNTGAIDPFPELAALCRERGVWLHIDAAYGGFAVLTERGRQLFEGIELADSITVDPHKWLYQPFECGCLLVRDGKLLGQAFEIAPEYLADAHTERHVNFADRGMQLTRTSRALKVWVSLRYFGVNAFRGAIDRSLDLARVAERLIQASEVLELLTPATLGIVTFRRRIDGDDEGLSERVNAAVLNELAAEGTGFLSSTRLRGRYAIRMCVLNHSTTEDDVETIIRRIEQIDVGDLSAPTQLAAPASPRDAGVRMPWLTKPRIDAEALRSLPLFSSLSVDQAEEVLGGAEERRVPAGTDVIEQWQYAREFFVILEGTAEARSEHQLLRILGPGDFFGELAAFDWGAGYGYVRTASVTSTSSMRLLVLSSDPFNQLVREVPQIAAMIAEAKRERL